MNILYYSKYCNQCRILFQRLKERNLFSVFNKMICVDNDKNDGVKDNLPKQVTCVPFIITEDFEEPLVNNIVFEWIDFKYLEKRSKVVDKDTGEANKPTPFISGSNDNNQNAKKQTLVDFEKLQKLREIDDQKFRDKKVG